MVKAQNKLERQLNVCSKDFKPFVDRVVAEALKLYENLNVCIYNMEELVNDKLKELSIPNLARFNTELK